MLLFRYQQNSFSQVRDVKPRFWPCMRSYKKINVRRVRKVLFLKCLWNCAIILNDFKCSMAQLHFFLSLKSPGSPLIYTAVFWFPRKNRGIPTPWEKEIGRAIRGLEKRIIWVPKDFSSYHGKPRLANTRGFIKSISNHLELRFKSGIWELRNNFPVFSIYVYQD